jgi:hypothetical protein
VQGAAKDRISPLWIPPWPTIEPYYYSEKTHPDYGPATEAKLLSGLAGHSICLDFFGPPSQEEARLGIPEHGEAGCRPWRVTGLACRPERVALSLSVDLPLAQLRFKRRLELRFKEPIVYFTEIVKNRRPLDHVFHWVQHVTLGPPFLSSKKSRVAIPGTQALTYPYGYDEGKALLLSKRRFRWPNAPLTSGRTIDLSRPFQESGKGFVVSVLLDRKRSLGFVATINQETSVLMAYCFRRADYPWVAVWEENRALSAAPWKRRTRARGLEFGTTPFPLERREAFSMGKVLGESTSSCIPAKGQKMVRYFAFLTKAPSDFETVSDIKLTKAGISVIGTKGEQLFLETPYPARFLGAPAVVGL